MLQRDIGVHALLTPAAVFPFPTLLAEICGAESEPKKKSPVDVTAALTK